MLGRGRMAGLSWHPFEGQVHAVASHLFVDQVTEAPRPRAFENRQIHQNGVYMLGRGRMTGLSWHPFEGQVHAVASHMFFDQVTEARHLSYTNRFQ
jgi:hypothetical protein